MGELMMYKGDLLAVFFFADEEDCADQNKDNDHGCTNGEIDGGGIEDDLGIFR
jgi:hypothetical protein